MKTVFVDVDDTLILYKKDGKLTHPYLFYDAKFEINEKLVGQLIKLFLLFTNNDNKVKIVIWSGGGKKYAKEVADWVFCGRIVYDVLDKAENFNHIKPGDIVIDDQISDFYTLKSCGVKLVNPLGKI